MEISAINNRYNVATKSQYDTPVNTNYSYPANTNIDYPAYAEESSKKMPLGLILLGVLGVTAVGIAIHKNGAAKKAAKSLEEKTAELEKLTKDNQEVKDKLTTTERALEEANGKINKYIQKGREARRARREARKALNLVEKPEKTEKKGIFKRIKEKFSSIFNRNNNKA